MGVTVAVSTTGTPNIDGFGDARSVTVVCASSRCGRAARSSKHWEKPESLRADMEFSDLPIQNIIQVTRGLLACVEFCVWFDPNPNPTGKNAVLLPKHLHFRKTQVIRAGKLHADIAPLRASRNHSGWIGRRGLTTAERSRPAL